MLYLRVFFVGCHKSDFQIGHSLLPFFAQSQLTQLRVQHLFNLYAMNNSIFSTFCVSRPSFINLAFSRHFIPLKKKESIFHNVFNFSFLHSLWFPWQCRWIAHDWYSLRFVWAAFSATMKFDIEFLLDKSRTKFKTVHFSIVRKEHKEKSISVSFIRCYIKWSYTIFNQIDNENEAYRLKFSSFFLTFYSEKSRSFFRSQQNLQQEFLLFFLNKNCQLPEKRKKMKRLI